MIEILLGTLIALVLASAVARWGDRRNYRLAFKVGWSARGMVDDLKRIPRAIARAEMGFHRMAHTVDRLDLQPHEIDMAEAERRILDGPPHHPAPPRDDLDPNGEFREGGPSGG